MEAKIWIKTFGVVVAKPHPTLDNTYRPPQADVIAWEPIGEWRGERQSTLAECRTATDAWLNRHLPGQWANLSEDIPYYYWNPDATLSLKLMGSVNCPILIQYDDPSRMFAFLEDSFAMQNVEILQKLQRCVAEANWEYADLAAQEYQMKMNHARAKAAERIQARYEEWEQVDLKILDYEGKR